MWKPQVWLQCFVKSLPGGLCPNTHAHAHTHYNKRGMLTWFKLLEKWKALVKVVQTNILLVAQCTPECLKYCPTMWKNHLHRTSFSKGKRWNQTSDFLIEFVQFSIRNLINQNFFGWHFNLITAKQYISCKQHKMCYMGMLQAQENWTYCKFYYWMFMGY